MVRLRLQSQLLVSSFTPKTHSPGLLWRKRFNVIYEGEMKDMSDFKVHNSQSAPEGSDEILEAVQKKYGFVPNLFGVLAESPRRARVLYLDRPLDNPPPTR